MENFNIIFVLTLISFTLLIVCGILSYVNFTKWSAKAFWAIFGDASTSTSISTSTISVNKVVLYIMFSILLFFAFLSFIFIIMYRNDEGLKSGILGKYSKFHFIPILCSISLYIIGFTLGSSNYYKETPYIFSLIFTLIGICSLIFIYIKTNMSKYYARLAIKKGLYSCLIALFVYNLCFTITFLGSTTITSNRSNWINWIKGCYIAFSLIIGIINLLLSFFLKDIIISGMNILIYLGLTINFFKINKSIRDNINGVAEGIIDIIIGVLSICMICFLPIRYKNSITN